MYMQAFHILLTQFIAEKHVTIYGLAKTSGVERTHIQKMKAGVRVPSDRNTVLKLAKALMLSASETTELLEAYAVAKMGPNKYYQRLFVQNIISGFGEAELKNDLLVETSTQNKLTMTRDYEHVSGSAAVHRVLKAVMEIEAAQEEPRICVLAQPDFAYLYDCIATLAPRAQIDNIIALYKQEDDSSVNYNLDVFQKLLPLFFGCPNFHPYYVHDQVSTLYSDTGFFPVVIITGDYVLRIANDYKSALLYNDEKLRSIFLEKFSQRLLGAKPILESISTEPEEFFARISSLGFGETEAIYNLMFQPCLIPYIPRQTIDNCLRKEILTPRLYEQAQEYLTRSYSKHKNFQTVFTQEGLELFLRSGRIIEIPGYMLRANPDRKQRLEIMSAFINMLEEGSSSARIAKPGRLAIPRPLLINACNKQQVIIQHFSESGGMRIFRLEEASLVNAFHDFLAYVQDSELVYSREETLAIVKKLFDKTFKNICK